MNEDNQTAMQQTVERIEKRIEQHLNQALARNFSEKVDWNIKMANQWIDTLANYRNLPPAQREGPLS